MAPIKRFLSRKNTPPSQKSTIFFAGTSSSNGISPFSLPAPVISKFFGADPKLICYQAPITFNQECNLKSLQCSAFLLFLDNDDKFKYTYKKILNQTPRVAWKRNAEPNPFLTAGFIQNLNLSWVSSRIEIHLLLAICKNWLTFNPYLSLRQAMKKGLQKMPMWKPPRVFYTASVHFCPLQAELIRI